MQKESEHQHNEPKLHFKINGIGHVWHNQYITNKEIRELAKIPGEDEIYLQNKVPFEDDLIKDNVDLARPGLEDLYSIRPNEIFLIICTSQGDWKEKFSLLTKVSEVIQAVIKHFGFTPGDNYELGYSHKPLDKNKTLGEFHFKNCFKLTFTDLGNGATNC